ncbi:MAG TPA: hypothetical protein VIQ81_13615 [Gammaproteobacteria bacterium]
MGLKQRLMYGLLPLAAILALQPANAALVQFDFTGVVRVTSGHYTSGESFSGHYIIDTTVSGTESIRVYSSGDRITSTNYNNPVTEFEMIFADKTISYTPDGLFGSSSIRVFNDQRFNSYGGGSYYLDRLITNISDVNGSVGRVDLVQFDWGETSSNGWPGLLTSSEMPVVATDYSVDYYQGSISADGNQNIHFQLTSLEVTAVPLPAPIWLFLSGLLSLFAVTKRKSSIVA